MPPGIETHDDLLRMTPEGQPMMRDAIASDRNGVRRLLTDASLPTADLESALDLRFWVAEQGGSLVGAVGLERHGATGLLRSLVVSPAHQDRGLGRRLVATLEESAPAAGVDLLVLLTLSAKGFFERLGYRVADRGNVPDDVKESAEFRSLCPATATCMAKSLLPRPGDIDG